MSIFKSIGKATVISAFGTIASYALTIMLARNSGVAPFGEYMLCLAWATILTVLIDCASDAAFSHLSINSGNIQSSLNTAITIRVTTLIILVGLFGIAKATSLIDTPWLVFLFAIPAFNLGLLFELYRSNVEFAAIICIEKILLLIMNSALLSLVKFEVAVYLSYATVTVLSLAWQVYIHRDHIRAFRPAKANSIKAYLNSYWPILMLALAQISYGHISRLVIEGKQGLVAFVAVSLAFQVIALASLIQTQVDRNFRPMIIETVAVGNGRRLWELIYHYLLISTLPMAIGSMIIFAIAPWLIFILFGAEYQLTGHVLRELSPLFVSINLMRLADLLMLALGLTRENLAINLCASLMMLLLMLNVPDTQPLTLLMSIVVGTQFAQATLSGVLALRLMRRRIL